MSHFVSDSYLDAFFIIDSADHLDTHLSNLAEGWLLQADVSEDLDHSLSDTDTSILHTKTLNIIDMIIVCCEAMHQKQGSYLHEDLQRCSYTFLPTGDSRRPRKSKLSL